MTLIARHRMTQSQAAYQMLTGFWWIVTFFFHFSKNLYKELTWKPGRDLLTSGNFKFSLPDIEKGEDTDCPEFQEILELGGGLILGIEQLIRCPDETAVVRVLGDDVVSKQYKKKVLNHRGNKYIVVDGRRFYLSKSKVWLE